MSKVRKAVIPAAGYGTRMLPITKCVTKEMLPLVDKPIIQVVVEELVAAGVEDIIIIIRDSRPDLPTYFGDVDRGLAAQLRSGGAKKQAMLQDLEAIQGLANFTFLKQSGQHGYGTGAVLLVAEPYLNDEPFIFTFGDDFFVGGRNSYSQMLEAYDHYVAPIIGCQSRTADEDYDRYGYVGGTELRSSELEVQKIVEKPGKANAPGNFASFGGFVVTPDALSYIHKARDQLQAGQELYFNSALNLMLADGKRVIAKEIRGAHYYDTGNKLEYMKTAVAMAAAHPEIGTQFHKFLVDFVNKKGSQ